MYIREVNRGLRARHASEFGGKYANFAEMPDSKRAND
jgi:hypothetical protein